MRAGTPSFKRHKYADERIEGARRLVRVLVEAEGLYPAHRAEFIKLALWVVTEAEAGKINTRYRSRASCEPGAIIQHDHVYQRAKMAAQLIAHPDELDTILDTAVGCVVTKEEHSRLTAVGREQPELDGWDRYLAAGIEVVDMATGTNAALAASPTTASD